MADGQLAPRQAAATARPARRQCSQAAPAPDAAGAGRSPLLYQSIRQAEVLRPASDTQRTYPALVVLQNRVCLPRLSVQLFRLRSRAPRVRAAPICHHSLRSSLLEVYARVILAAVGLPPAVAVRCLLMLRFAQST
eukprot:1084061-Pleurochrysis_carterae.AAC.2